MSGCKLQIIQIFNLVRIWVLLQLNFSIRNLFWSETKITLQNSTITIEWRFTVPTNTVPVPEKSSTIDKYLCDFITKLCLNWVLSGSQSESKWKVESWTGYKRLGSKGQVVFFYRVLDYLISKIAVGFGRSYFSRLLYRPVLGLLQLTITGI